MSYRREAKGESEMLSLKDKTGRPQTVVQWVAGMLPEDRAALHEALVPFTGESSPGPVSLEKLRADFGKLGKEDRVTFINGIRQGAAAAETAVLQEQVEAAGKSAIEQAKAQKEAVGKWL